MTTQINIIYPADPLGTIPGGIDTFIRGLLRWSPEDISFSVLGVTTDTVNRPVRSWTRCKIGDREFNFYPVIEFRDSEKQPKIPLTVRYIAGLLRSRREVSGEVLEFHRIEPCLAFLSSKKSKTLVVHQNMDVILTKASDIRWKYFPKAYFMLERFLMPRVQSIFCVREDAVERYQRQFPAISDRFHFTPTWVDPDMFGRASDELISADRDAVRAEFGFPSESRIFISVGRLDSQKNPLLLIEAFARVQGNHVDARLLIVGDGVLRPAVEKALLEHGIEDRVVLCGVKPGAEIARYLRASDAFVLSSSYEGMPICVLEALGSGIPVAATDVGEVSRVVKPGVNGELINVHTPENLAEAMEKCLENAHLYRGDHCYDAVEDYVPSKVLSPIYQNYRRLASG